MRIPICLRGERAASMHFVKYGAPETAQRVGPCTGKPLPRRRISRIVCDGGLSGCESMHLSGPENRTSPLCKSARGSASAWSSWTAVSWGRDSGVWDRGWAGGRHPFWGRGSNGCKSLTRSKLEEPFLWLLFPATSSPLSVERKRSRRAPKWRPRRWNAGVFERIGVNNLVYYPHNPLWHSGDGLPGLGPCGKGLDKLEWPAARGRALVRTEEENCSFFENVCVLFFPLSQRTVAWALVRTL